MICRGMMYAAAAEAASITLLHVIGISLSGFEKSGRKEEKLRTSGSCSSDLVNPRKCQDRPKAKGNVAANAPFVPDALLCLARLPPII